MSVFSNKIKTSEARILPHWLAWEFASLLVGHFAYLVLGTKKYHLIVINIDLIWRMFTHLSHPSNNSLAQTMHHYCST